MENIIRMFDEHIAHLQNNLDEAKNELARLKRENNASQSDVMKLIELIFEIEKYSHAVNSEKHYRSQIDNS